MVTAYETDVNYYQEMIPELDSNEERSLPTNTRMNRLALSLQFGLR